MNQLKVFYLCPELTPFSESNSLASFSNKLSCVLHEKDNYDIRLLKPKYGFISERKYILREVIRLKDMEIEFGGEQRLMNIKSAFIPETRVQVYFLQDDDYFKPLTQLLYKAKNGRVLNDNDIRFALFAKVALDTLKRLYWKPDVIVCSDWQMSFVPQLLKENYSDDEFYSNIKAVSVIHSLNDFRMFSEKSYGMINLNYDSKNKLIDNYTSSIKHSDHVILIDDEKNTLDKQIKANKDLKNLYKKSSNSSIVLPNEATTSDWMNLINSFDSILNKL
jgi:starch synthase|tara:strand:+ start:1257 stop:2087 length:831 start_codon:yes stop_codon:yes gene_type:complete